MVAFLNSSLVLGQVTSERLAAVRIPTALRPSVESFGEVLESLKDADARVQVALAAHANEQRHVQATHLALRTSLEALAAAIVQLDPTMRLQPFAPFGSSPSKILRTTRAGAARATKDLAQRVLASSPAKPVREAANACIKHAEALESAHRKLTPFAVELKRAREERDGLLADFASVFRRMKAFAKCVWAESPSDYTAIFAKTERFRLNSKRRDAKGAKAEPPAEPVSPNPPTPPQPAAQPAAAAAGQPAGAGATPVAAPTAVTTNHLLN